MATKRKPAKIKNPPGWHKYLRADGMVARSWLLDELRLAYIEGYNANKTGKPFPEPEYEIPF
jgi:hypothetical protein